MRESARLHAALAQLAVRDDCLLIGGQPVTRLAQRAGSTPFYAYDRGAISERIASLRKRLPSAVRLHYAVKANPMPAVVQHLAGLVDGFDVASAGELKIALDTPMPAEAISFAGPAKGDGELAQALAAGVMVHVESVREMERLAVLGRSMGLQAAIAVRINPDFELKASGMKMGGGARQFGIDAEAAPAALQRAAALGLEVRGLQVFAGSQNLRAEALCELHENIFRLAQRLAPVLRKPLRTLNFGGGFGVPYFPGEQPLDLARVGAGLDRLLPPLLDMFPGLDPVIELGRYLVAEAGYYVCKVVERKLSRGQVFLMTDGGMHHHLAASGNLGQVIRKNYPVLIGNRVAGGEREPASVAGPLCTPLDLLADQLEMARAEPGDLVVVLQSGAYGPSASPTAFLGHPPPVEILV